MNALHIRQLEAMGIRVWVPRTAASADSRPLIPLLVPDGAPVIVLLEAGDELQLDAAHPAGGLLLNILDALKAPDGSFAIYRLNAAPIDASELRAVIGAAQTVLWFGDAPPPDAGDMLVLPSLQRMLDDPNAKRPAWAKLKPLVARIAGGSP